MIAAMGSSYTQVGLGLRSLAIKAAVFVVLAGLLAWTIGGSIFPGSQVVNCPALEWAGVKWHPQVTGNGRGPAPVEWRVLRTDTQGHSTSDALGVAGVWRQLRGPVIRDGAMIVAVESEVDGVRQWWTVSIDKDGTPKSVPGDSL